MNTLLRLFFVFIALGCAGALRAEVSARAWLESYYLNPQPAEVPRAIKQLSREGYFEGPGHAAVAIGFLGTLFAQSPDRVDAWLLELNGLPLRHNRLLAAALWQAGHPLGPELLRVLSQFSSLRMEIERLAGTPSISVLETPVRSASSMNLQWGAFLATGDERYILTIFEAIGTNQPGLDSSAQVALAQHAAGHPRVLDICRAQLDRQPEEVQNVLRAAVGGLEKAKPRG